MTNIVTVRLRRPKAELLERAKPNLNAWINNLIDDALGPKKVDWDAHFQRRKSRKPARYRSDEIRQMER